MTHFYQCHPLSAKSTMVFDSRISGSNGSYL